MNKRVRKKIERKKEIEEEYLSLWVKVLKNVEDCRKSTVESFRQPSIGVGIITKDLRIDWHVVPDLNKIKRLCKSERWRNEFQGFISVSSSNSGSYSQLWGQSVDIFIASSIMNIVHESNLQNKGIMVPYLFYRVIENKEPTSRSDLSTAFRDKKKVARVSRVFKGLVKLGTLRLTEINSVWFEPFFFEVHSKPENGSFSYVPSIGAPNNENRIQNLERKLNKLRR